MLLIAMVKVVLGFESVVVVRFLSPLFVFRLKSAGIFFIQLLKKYVTF